MKHLIAIDDLNAEELAEICRLAKLPVAEVPTVLAGKGVAAIFEKPSARTRNSTEMAVVDLGGHPVYITGQEVGIGKRESPADVIKTMACYHNIVCLRVFDHHHLEQMVACNAVPVINLLSDRAHPLQAIADVLTIQATFGSLKDRTVTYVGDINNVAVSLGLAVTLAGGQIRYAAPVEYSLQEQDAQRIEKVGGAAQIFTDPHKAIVGSDVVYTDTWTSMGQEAEAAQRVAAFADYSVTEDLMAKVPEAIFMHCLPAHRGEEVSDAVIDGPQSNVWSQAAFRQNAIRGVLLWLLQNL